MGKSTKTKRKTKEQQLEGLRQFLNRTAKKNRNNLNKYENLLLKTLRDLGYDVKVQFPIIHKTKGYIVDFLLPQYRLIIEADGKSVHGSKEAQKRDYKRTRHLFKEGYHMLRLWNKQIMTFSKEMIDQIIKTRIGLLKDVNTFGK